MWDSMPGHGGFMGIGGIFGLLIWLFLIVVVVAMVWWLFVAGNSRAVEPSSLEILKRRYAAGEISEEEYMKMKDRLESRD